MRLIGFLIFITYQLLFLPRIMFSSKTMSQIPTGLPQLNFPPIMVVDSVVFGVFCFLSVMFAGNLFNNRGSFRAADVDVLFPTPVDPRSVLALKVVKDIWLNLLLPLFLAILFWRPAKLGWANLFHNIPNPESANSVLRSASVAYFLSALAWVWVGYAATLVLSKPDIRTDRLRSGLTWGIIVGILGLCTLGYLQVRGSVMPDSLIQLAHDQALRGVFFFATAATNVTMGPLSGNTGQVASGVVVLLGFLIGAIALACSKTQWMYEQAAMRTSVTEATLKLRRSGDVYGIAARSAQSGKIKAGRTKWLSRITVSGPWALLWKELLISRRTTLSTLFIYVVMSCGISFFVCLLPVKRGGENMGVLLLLFQAMVLLGPAMGLAQAGFIENLRRIDLLKPLPFKSQVIVACEVVNKSLGTILALVAGLILAAILKPIFLPYCLAGLLMFPGFALALSSLSLLLVLLLPDVEDPTQRSFRGLATLLGIVTCTGPPIAVFGLLLFLKVPIIVAAIPTCLLMVAVAYGTTYFAGRTYESFNPSD